MTALLALLSRFGMVGLAATATYLVVANLLMMAGTIPVYGSVAGYLAGMAVSFLGQSRFTFRIRKAQQHHLMRFCLLSAVGLFVSYAAVQGAGAAGLAPVIGTIATAILIPLMSFAAMKLWVFRHPS